MFNKTGLKLPKKLNLKILSNSFTIIFLLMLFFIVFSWVGHLAHLGNIKGLGVMDVFPAVWRGFVERTKIILFVFAIGGVLAVMEHSKVLDSGVAALTRKMHGKEVWLIPLLMMLFGLGGTTYGMWEETLAFFPVIIPVFIKAKFDGITGVLVVLLGAGTGCLASSINPFSVGLAFQTVNATGHHVFFNQGTHLIFRWLIWIIFMIPAITFVMWYAIRVRKGKRASFLTFQNNALLKAKFVKEHHDSPPSFTMRRKISLFIFFTIFLIMILAYLPWNEFLGTARVNAFNHFMNRYLFFFRHKQYGPKHVGSLG